MSEKESYTFSPCVSFLAQSCFSSIISSVFHVLSNHGLVLKVQLYRVEEILW